MSSYKFCIFRFGGLSESDYNLYLHNVVSNSYTHVFTLSGQYNEVQAIEDLKKIAEQFLTDNVYSFVLERDDESGEVKEV